MKRNVCLWGIALFVATIGNAHAQTGDGSRCVPGCRSSYVCVEARCVSACNPPCAEGSVCSAQAECIPSTDAVISESPVFQPEEPEVVSTVVQVEHSEVSQREIGYGPSEPNVSTDDFNGFRFHAGLSFGFGGAIKEETKSMGIRIGNVDLAPTIGADIRGLFGFLNYVAVGISARFNFFNIKDSRVDRMLLLDPGLTVRGRYPISLGEMVIEPYGEFSVGPTIFVSGEDAQDLDPTIVDFSVGYFLGLEAGATVFFTSRIGAHIQLGWRRHAYATTSDLRAAMSQFQLGLGASFRLGG